MVPTVEECSKFMEKYQTLDNIKSHSMMVEKVASIIARGLRAAGVDISLKTITAGALMHDIGKTLCLGSGDDHAALGREICLQNRLDEIADIVGEHVRLKAFKSDGVIHEKEIVYYADKRVNHDKIVSLEERLAYLLRRYGKNEESLFRLIKENFALCKLVERKLFCRLEFGPEDLAQMIQENR